MPFRSTCSGSPERCCWLSARCWLSSAGRRSPESQPRPFDLPALVAVFVAGVLVGFQHPLNGLLSESSGELLAGLTNFVVGTALLAVVVFATGRAARLPAVRQAPRWQLLGGLIGVITVLAALTAVSIVGAAGLTAALVTGQLIGSIAIDRVGAFGLAVRAITYRRAFGALLLIARCLALRLLTRSRFLHRLESSACASDR